MARRINRRRIEAALNTLGDFSEEDWLIGRDRDAIAHVRDLLDAYLNGTV